MADQSDVEATLAAVISDALYPDGTAAESAVEAVCRMYRGFPVVNALETELQAGIVHVTVQAVADSVKDTSRYPREWVGQVPVCPLVVETAGAAIRFSGEAVPGTVAGVMVDGRAYAWRVGEPSTPGVVAAVLADLVRADRPAELSHATVSFPQGRGVLGRAVSDGVGGEELRRQEATFRVTAWCPSAAVRDRVCAFVDLVLAGIVFLDVDGWGCRVTSAGGSSHDEKAGAGAWRRELLYRVEYPTVLKRDLPTMLFGAGSVNGAGFFG